MNFEVVFHPDGSLSLPDLPPELLPVMDAFGQQRPAPRPALGTVRPPGALPQLAERTAAARQALANCCLCELRCGANRWRGELGRCQGGRRAYVARCFLNYSEESRLGPAVVVDLSGCNWNCVYCQYPAHLQPRHGRLLRPAALAARVAALSQQGGASLHWVGGNPDQHLWPILATLQLIRAPLAVVWNTNGYAAPELLDLLEGIVHTYVVDFRHANPGCAGRLGLPPDSPGILRRNLKRLAAQEAGLIVRVLQLPGHWQCCTAPILRWLAEALPGVPVNLMNGQYRPARFAYRFAEINRRLTPTERANSEKMAYTLGLELVS